MLIHFLTYWEFANIKTHKISKYDVLYLELLVRKIEKLMSTFFELMERMERMERMSNTLLHT